MKPVDTMTRREVNEFLAEHLFGYERFEQEDECHQPETIWGSVRGNPAYCEYDFHDVDFHLNWQKVVERLYKKTQVLGHSVEFVGLDECVWEASVTDIEERGYYGIKSHGKTMGDAICRVVVEFLRFKEVYQ